MTDPDRAAPVPPTPTLDDVQRLTPDSDFKPYTARDLDPAVRNEALRKLFLGDPHFQQSDGLDVRVDEVTALASSPQARQQKILQARALGLLDDDLIDQEHPDDAPGAPRKP